MSARPNEISTQAAVSEVKELAESTPPSNPPILPRRHSMPNLQYTFPALSYASPHRSVLTLDYHRDTRNEPVSSSHCSSRTFDTNYPDSNRSSQASSHPRQQPNQQPQSFNNNDLHCDTPSNKSQGSSNSENQTPLTPITPLDYTDEKPSRPKPGQIFTLPAYTRGNSSHGILAQAWHSTYQTTLREAQQAHETQLRAEKAKLEAEKAKTEKLEAENETLTQKFIELETAFAAMQTEKIALERQLASTQGIDYFNSQIYLGRSGPHINLASLPSTQSSSAIGTPSSTTTTVEPGSISSSLNTAPLRVASRPTLLDICCGCFKP